VTDSNWQGAFPSKYLSAADVKQPIRTKVKTAGFMTLEGKLKVVVTFENIGKEMILNKTNCVMLASIAGTDDMNAWIGAPVIIRTETVTFKGDLVTALRLYKATEDG